MAHTAAIALGSNLPSSFGAPADNLREAIRRLASLGRIVAVSSLRVTEPVGYLDQPRFTNGAALLETDLAPLDLLRALLAIEQAMGRIREGGPEKGPRILDLDLLFVDDCVLATPELTLPHPALHGRAFVLEPLAEIAPDWEHPVLGVTVKQMLAEIALKGRDFSPAL